jgi:hypothetical protein
VVPHDDDTGGFFISKFRKLAEVEERPLDLPKLKNKNKKRKGMDGAAEAPPVGRVLWVNQTDMVPLTDVKVVDSLR